MGPAIAPARLVVPRDSPLEVAPAGAGAKGDVFSQEVALALYTGAAGRAPEVGDILNERLLAHPSYRTQGRGIFPSAPLPYRGLAGPPLPGAPALRPAETTAAAAAAAPQRQNPSQHSENMRKLLSGEETRQCLVRGRKRCGPGRGGDGGDEGPQREETPFARAQVPLGAHWRDEREGLPAESYFNRKVSDKVGADGPLDKDVYVENIRTMKTVKPKKPLTAGQLLPPGSRSGLAPVSRGQSRGGTAESRQGTAASRQGTMASRRGTAESRWGTAESRRGTGGFSRGGGTVGETGRAVGVNGGAPDSGTYILNVRPGTGVSRPGTGTSRPGTGARRAGTWAGTQSGGPTSSRSDQMEKLSVAAAGLGLAGGGSRPGTAAARAEKQAAEWRKKSGAVANKLEALLEGDGHRLTQKVGTGGAFSSHVYRENLRTQKTIKPQKTKTITPVPPPAS